MPAGVRYCVPDCGAAEVRVWSRSFYPSRFTGKRSRTRNLKDCWTGLPRRYIRIRFAPECLTIYGRICRKGRLYCRIGHLGAGWLRQIDSRYGSNGHDEKQSPSDPPRQSCGRVGRNLEPPSALTATKPTTFSALLRYAVPLAARANDNVIWGHRWMLSYSPDSDAQCRRTSTRVIGEAFTKSLGNYALGRGRKMLVRCTYVFSKRYVSFLSCVRC
jgi:hypothetical protein